MVSWRRVIVVLVTCTFTLSSSAVYNCINVIAIIITATVRLSIDWHFNEYPCPKVFSFYFFLSVSSDVFSDAKHRLFHAKLNVPYYTVFVAVYYFFQINLPRSDATRKKKTTRFFFYTLVGFEIDPNIVFTWITPFEMSRWITAQK